MGLLDKLFGGGKKAETTGSSGMTIEYLTASNETCRSLAKKFYGDENQWQKIYGPNERLIKDEVQSGTDPLLPGTKLTIKDPKFDASGQPVAA